MERSIFYSIPSAAYPMEGPWVDPMDGLTNKENPYLLYVWYRNPFFLNTLPWWKMKKIPS